MRRGACEPRDLSLLSLNLEHPFYQPMTLAETTWYWIFYGLASVQSLGLGALLLWIKTKHPTPNRVLAALMFCLGFLFFEYSFNSSDVYVTALLHSQWAVLADACMLLIWPLLYIYVIALTDTDFCWLSLQRRHLYPTGVLMLAYVLTISLGLNSREKQQWLQGFMATLFTQDTPIPVLRAQWLTLILYQVVLLQAVYYSVCILRHIRRYHAAIKEYFSTLERHKLVWLSSLVIIHAIGFILHFIPWNLFWLGADSSAWLIWISVWPVLSSIALGYAALLHPQALHGGYTMPVVAETESPAPIMAAPEAPTEKYTRSSLTDVEADHYQDKLLQLMQEQKPYLNNNLTLPELAAQLDMRSPKHLSQILNQRLQQTFFDFINRYRIEEATRQLQQPDAEGRVLHIALSSGFNSEPSFYRAFKAHTGLTPTEYRKRHGQRRAD